MQKTLLLWIFLAGLCAATTTRAVAQATAAGRIVLARVAGDVTVADNATKAETAAVNGREISQGFTVKTTKGASVVLVFSNGATINLKEESELNIEKYLQDPFAQDFNPATATEEPSSSITALNLTKGELVGNVKKLNKEKASSFNVQTPVGAAGIRGTTFRIVYRPKGDGTATFTLTTTDGTVVLTTGTVTLPVGAGVNNDQPKEIVIEVTVNPTTGVATITTPTATLVVSAAPLTSVSAVVEAAAVVAQAVATVVFAPVTPAPATPPTPPKEEPKPPEKKPEEKPATPAPAVVPPAPTLTSGAGGTP